MGFTEEVALEQALEGWRGGGQVVLWGASMQAGEQHKQRHVEVGTHTLGGSDWLGPEVVEENRRG